MNPPEDLTATSFDAAAPVTLNSTGRPVTIDQMLEQKMMSDLLRASHQLQALKTFRKVNDKRFQDAEIDEARRKEVFEPLIEAQKEIELLKKRIQRRDATIVTLQRQLVHQATNRTAAILSGTSNEESKVLSSIAAASLLFPSSPQGDNTDKSNVMTTPNIPELATQQLQDQLDHSREVLLLQHREMSRTKKIIKGQVQKIRQLALTIQQLEAEFTDSVRKLDNEKQVYVNLVDTKEQKITQLKEDRRLKQLKIEETMKENHYLSNSLQETQLKYENSQQKCLEMKQTQTIHEVKIHDLELEVGEIMEENTVLHERLKDLQNRYNRLVEELDSMVQDGFYVPTPVIATPTVSLPEESPMNARKTKKSSSSGVSKSKGFNSATSNSVTKKKNRRNEDSMSDVDEESVTAELSELEISSRRASAIYGDISMSLLSLRRPQSSLGTRGMSTSSSTVLPTLSTPATATPLTSLLPSDVSSQAAAIAEVAAAAVNSGQLGGFAARKVVEDVVNVETVQAGSALRLSEQLAQQLADLDAKRQQDNIHYEREKQKFGHLEESLKQANLQSSAEKERLQSRVHEMERTVQGLKEEINTLLQTNLALEGTYEMMEINGVMVRVPPGTLAKQLARIDMLPSEPDGTLDEEDSILAAAAAAIVDKEKGEQESAEHEPEEEEVVALDLLSYMFDWQNVRHHSKEVQTDILQYVEQDAQYELNDFMTEDEQDAYATERMYQRMAYAKFQEDLLKEQEAALNKSEEGDADDATNLEDEGDNKMSHDVSCDTHDLNHILTSQLNGSQTESTRDSLAQPPRGYDELRQTIYAGDSDRQIAAKATFQDSIQPTTRSHPNIPSNGYSVTTITSHTHSRTSEIDQATVATLTSEAASKAAAAVEAEYKAQFEALYAGFLATVSQFLPEEKLAILRLNFSTDGWSSELIPEKLAVGLDVKWQVRHALTLITAFNDLRNRFVEHYVPELSSASVKSNPSKSKNAYGLPTLSEKSGNIQFTDESQELDSTDFGSPKNGGSSSLVQNDLRVSLAVRCLDVVLQSLHHLLSPLFHVNQSTYPELSLLSDGPILNDSQRNSAYGSRHSSSQHSSRQNRVGSASGVFRPMSATELVSTHVQGVGLSPEWNAFLEPFFRRGRVVVMAPQQHTVEETFPLTRPVLTADPQNGAPRGILRDDASPSRFRAFLSSEPRQLPRSVDRLLDMLDKRSPSPAVVRPVTFEGEQSCGTEGVWADGSCMDAAASDWKTISSEGGVAFDITSDVPPIEESAQSRLLSRGRQRVVTIPSSKPTIRPQSGRPYTCEEISSPIEAPPSPPSTAPAQPIPVKPTPTSELSSASILSTYQSLLKPTDTTNTRSSSPGRTITYVSPTVSELSRYYYAIDDNTPTVVPGPPLLAAIAAKISPPGVVESSNMEHGNLDPMTPNSGNRRTGEKAKPSPDDDTNLISVPAPLPIIPAHQQNISLSNTPQRDANARASTAPHSPRGSVPIPPSSSPRSRSNLAAAHNLLASRPPTSGPSPAKYYSPRIHRRMLQSSMTDSLVSAAESVPLADLSHSGFAAEVNPSMPLDLSDVSAMVTLDHPPKPKTITQPSGSGLAILGQKTRQILTKDRLVQTLSRPGTRS